MFEMSSCGPAIFHALKAVGTYAAADVRDIFTELNNQQEQQNIAFLITEYISQLLLTPLPFPSFLL